MPRSHAPLPPGARFGRWTILDGPHWSSGGRNPRYRARCECGTERNVLHQALKLGTSASCGCLAREQLSHRATHGQTGTHLFRAWQNMRHRAGRGPGAAITGAWQRFEGFSAWAIAHGYRDGTRLARINLDGGFNPENCRWEVRQRAGRQCVICAGPLPRLPANRVTCGAECRREQNRRIERRRRQRKPGISTPYVKTWRERNPEKRRAAINRERKQALADPERRPRYLAHEQRRVHRQNDETREQAEAHKQPWAPDEEQYLIDHPELSHIEAASALGRTRHAINTRRNDLRRAGRL